jgi:putative endonuclease
MVSDWKVYVLRCSDNSLYTGITRDLNRRLDEHNNNDRLASAYTRARRPVDVVYQESHVDRSAASKREAEIKKLTKTEKEELIRKKHGKK